VFRLIPRLVFSCTILIAAVLGWQLGQARSDSQKIYVGADACSKCHEEQYHRFRTYAKKAHSYEHIMTMKKGLTEAEFRQCLECHTTGYGKPGGFRSEQETPHLREAGCEVCHGPGSVHAESQSPKDINKTLSTTDCEACHNSERVEAFRYRPLIFGGAH
jgi:hypothetical protein